MGLDVVFKMVLKCAFPGCPNREKPTRKRKSALPFHQKYLNLCSEDERRSYAVGTT